MINKNRTIINCLNLLENYAITRLLIQKLKKISKNEKNLKVLIFL